MKNALILHGTGGDSQENWFPWLKAQLEQRGFAVFVPDLPGADRPNINRYNQFIFQTEHWHFDQETILIGHSSGAVALLGLLASLPANVQVAACYLVGAFKDDLGWEALHDLFLEPFNFVEIKKKAKKFVFVHSDNDPYCPLAHAQFLAKELEGELVVIPNQKHFSIGTAGEQYRQFPKLLALITNTAH